MGMPKQPDDPNSLYSPFSETLHQIGFGEHNSFHHFELGTLFWSDVRLFGCYERIASVLPIADLDARPFLNADIEHFIIRFRIVLNDIAFVVRQLLPANARGINSPQGGAHPLNREVSFFELTKRLKVAGDAYSELASVMSCAAVWSDPLRKQRDQIIHYKAKAVVFESCPLEYALIAVAGTEAIMSTPEGGARIVMHPVPELVDGNLVRLYRFVHGDLDHAVRRYADRAGIKRRPAGTGTKMSAIGIARFRERNNGKLTW